VSLVASGIAEHGEAYAAWVKYVGDTSGDLLDDERFLDHYQGAFDSLENYVEHVLSETDFYVRLEEVLGVFPRTCVETSMWMSKPSLRMGARVARDGG
jgi:antirestriction protein